MSVHRPRLKSSLPKRATWSEPSTTSSGEANPGTPVALASGDTEAADVAATQRRMAMTTTSKRRLQRRATPLELIQQPLEAAGRKVFDLRRFLVVLAATGLVLVLPTPPGLTPEGKSALALFVFTGMILSLQPVPLPIAALLVPIAEVALGIDQIGGAFAPFADPVIYLILASLFLAEALRKHGLTRRLALYAIVYSRGQFYRLVLILIALTAVLGMWVLNTATAAMLIPVAISIAQQIRDPADAKRMLAVLVLAIAYGASIGGIGTPMGSGENAIASGQLSQVMNFTFFQWISYGLPAIVVLVPLTWGLLLFAYRVPNVRIEITPALRELARARGLNHAEREILVVLGLSITLWIGGAAIERWLNLPATLLSSAVVAILAVALLSIEELIDWNDLKSVNWGIIFVIGAGLALGDALDKSGASAWLVSLVEPALAGLPYAAVLFLLIASTFTLTQFMNSVTYGAILSPILVTLAVSSSIAPPRLILPFVFTLALCYTLPNSSARMTLVVVSGAVDSKSMLRTGLIVGIPSAIFVFLFFLVISTLGLI
ncbi:MAG: DASS family sodium-coupled anion symporter [Anaerolineales bacterium]|nr:DASS family sodium-coupled anion symporter [Anaerolineales bacterium]